MEALTENPLALMPGPVFLVFYGFLAVGAIALLYFRWSAADNGRPLPPVPAKPDPYELAYLRDGAPGVAWLAIYGLKRAGRAELDAKGRLAPRDGPPPADLYQQAALDEIGRGCMAADVVKGARFAALGQKLQERLAARGLASKPEEQAQIWREGFAAGAALLALAGYKLLVAVGHGHKNVGGLIVMALFAAAILAAIANAYAGAGANARGRAWLSRIKLAYQGARADPEPSGGASFGPMLLVGLYGYTVLSGGPDAAFAQQARAQQSSGGCGGSGGSCSGGGGCGGGGCGGCGS